MRRYGDNAFDGQDAGSSHSFGVSSKFVVLLAARYWSGGLDKVVPAAILGCAFCYSVVGHPATETIH